MMSGVWIYPDYFSLLNTSILCMVCVDVPHSQHGLDGWNEMYATTEQQPRHQLKQLNFRYSCQQLLQVPRQAQVQYWLKHTQLHLVTTHHQMPYPIEFPEGL